MNFVRPRLLSLMVFSALSALAIPTSTLWAQGIKLESVERLSPPTKLSHDTPSFVSANRIVTTDDETIELQGNAEIRRGGAVIRGNEISYSQKTDEAKVTGNAKISLDGAIFTGPSMSYRLTSQSGEINDAQYEYVPRNIRGCAKNIRFISGDKTEFEDVKVTTCKRGDDAWFIKLDKLSVDEFDKTATGTNASLHFMGVPIFGSPWFSFPVTNERRSGLLTPSFGMSSSRGIDVSVPYYFNLAPNYDYTLTPRVMSKRGVLLQNDARVLYNHFNAEVQADYIPYDRITKEQRHGISTQAQYAQGKFAASLDYNRVSDDEFLNDFSTNIRETSQSILPQDYRISYNDVYWDTALSVNKNQTLKVKGIDYYKPYERIPHWQSNIHIGNWNGFEFRTLLDVARFKSDDRVDGDRTIVQQSVSYPLLAPSWYIFPRVSWLGSWYSLRHLERSSKLTNKTPHLNLPSLSLDTGLIFERQTHLFSRSVRQTLEPSIYYAWSPNRDLSALPFFDSTLADLSYAPLFMTNSFTGLDPVNESNQVSTILTTKFFDNETGLELLRASIGQRYHLRAQNIDPEAPGTTYKTGRSDLLAGVSAHLPHNLTVNGTAQYAAKSRRLVKFNAGMLWRPRPMSAVGLFYRFNDPGTPRSLKRDSIDDDHIKQIDFSVQWPLTSKLYALMRYNYSLNNRNAIEVLGGLEYIHDCWTMRFVAQRYNTASNKKETSFFFQLELSGLGSIGTSPIRELQRNIAGYQSATAYPERLGQYDYYE